MGCPSQIAHLVPKNNLFRHKKAVQPIQKGQTKGNGCYTASEFSPLRDTEPPFAPSLHNTSKERAKNSENWPGLCGVCVTKTQNKKRTTCSATCLKSEF